MSTITASTERAAPAEFAQPVPVVEVQELVKRFDQVPAVNGVSFSVGPGEAFGFLGPNGAGKSTTISILCTLLAPTSGTASVAGFDVARDPLRVRRRIGLVFQDPTLDEYLTAEENLRFHAQLYRVPRSQIAARLDAVLEMVELTERRTGLVRTFSGGMKRRLEIARGLMHSPEVLFLDEPTVGLDPQTRSHIWSYINELRVRERIRMFLTTHSTVLGVVDRLGPRVRIHARDARRACPPRRHRDRQMRGGRHRRDASGSRDPGRSRSAPSSR